MQFLAPDPLHVVIRNEDPALFDSRGRMVKPKGRRLYAKFRRGLPGEAVSAAVAAFDTGRLPEDMTPGRWFCLYDSNLDQQQMGWTDSEREAIEAKLIELGHLRFEAQKSDVPYDNYLKHRKVHGKRTVEHAIRDIVSAVELVGVSPDRIEAYERDHADESSDAILEGVRAALVAEEALVEA